jgi:hypothetical protein
MPPSEPLADAAELGAPPARTELREYIDDTDMRLDGSMSDIEGRGRNAASGSWECLLSSVIAPGESLGVSKSVIEQSSLLGLLLVSPTPVLGLSAPADLRLYVDDVRDLEEGGGIEMLARSEYVSVVPGSAYRPFREDNGFKLETGDRA